MFQNLDAKRGKDKIFWDDQIKDYRYKQNKKKLSERQLYSIVKQEVKRNVSKQEKLINQFVSNKISFEDWQKRSLEHIKESNINMTRLGRGGKSQTYANHYLKAGNELRTIHYPAHRKFAQDIKNGKLTKKQIINRARQYGISTKRSFEIARLSTLVENPKIIPFGRRRLGRCSPHCNECIYYATLGWQSLRDIIPPGVGCSCRGNCCCTIEVANSEKVLLGDSIVNKVLKNAA